MRTAAELRGSSASLRRAWKRSSSVLCSSLAIASSPARLSLNCATIFRRRSFLLIELFLAIWFSVLLPEREVERLEQRLRLVVGLRRRADDHVHAPDLINLVVVDLRENDVLLDAERVVAAAVEAFRVQPTEVAHARQRHRDQAIEELIHPRLAQRHLAADRHAGAQLEGGNRLPRLGHRRLLAGDLAEVAQRRVHLL